MLLSERAQQAAGIGNRPNSDRQADHGSGTGWRSGRLPKERIQKANDTAILPLANRLGAKLRHVGSEYNGPCPGCGGDDRFWVNPEKNVFLCRASGEAGGPVNLVQHVRGVGFVEAVCDLTDDDGAASGNGYSNGLANPAPQPKADEEAAAKREADQRWFRERERKRAYGIFNGGAPMSPRRDTLIGQYFAIRGITYVSWKITALRETQDLPYWFYSKADEQWKVIHRGPAMVAAITDDNGRFLGVHQTWIDLTRPKGKAAIAHPETGELLPAKKIRGSHKGGRIVLLNMRPVPKSSKGSKGRCTIGEGIETTLAWGQRYGHGFDDLWSGVTLGNMSGKAAAMVTHPSNTITVKRRDGVSYERRAKVMGPEPDMTDDEWLHVPLNTYDGVTLLGDSDSDRFTTQAAMIRAERRHMRAGHDTRLHWAPDGMDWDDALLNSRQKAGV